MLPKYASYWSFVCCAYNNNSNTINKNILIKKIELEPKRRLGFENGNEKKRERKEKGKWYRI